MSNCSSYICCLCCPSIGFCGISTGINELMVNGLPANVGIGIVPLLCLSSLAKEAPANVGIGIVPLFWSSSLAKEVPVPIVRGTALHDQPCHKTMRKYEYFEGMVVSLIPLRKFAIRTWFCNCPQYFDLLRIDVECSPSIHDQGMMSCLPNQLLC